MKPRVLFFGTPSFAIPALTALNEHATVVGVVTQPAKPVGRKKILREPPVAVEARTLGIPVFQPSTIRTTRPEGRAFLEEMRQLEPDIAVLVAYGKILPAELLALPPHGFLNIHPSLLPQYRGPSPIQSAIRDNVSETGVTIMLLDEGMDTGPILKQEVYAMNGSETSDELHERLFNLGAALLVPTLQEYMDGILKPKLQSDDAASVTSLLAREDGNIDWNKSAAEIERTIRAFTPWPGTYTTVGGKRVKILQAHLDDERLVIDIVQPEGKKPMPYSQYLAAYPSSALPPASE